MLEGDICLWGSGTTYMLLSFVSVACAVLCCFLFPVYVFCAGLRVAYAAIIYMCLYFVVVSTTAVLELYSCIRVQSIFCT